MRRICFEHADHLSGLVADLYRWWYARRGLPTNRMFVECFLLLDPWWVLRAGAVPYWMTFNSQAGADTLEAYLDAADPYHTIELTLVSNGVDAIGLAPVERWRRLLDRALVDGRFAGVDLARFPRDLGVFARYRDTLRAGRRWPVPAPLGLGELDDFLATCGQRYPVAVG